VLFGVVLLHELGHSLMARRLGVHVVDITLWPLGGLARMAEIPESSRVEGLIAIAGPAVNFALAGLGLGALPPRPLQRAPAWLSHLWLPFLGVNLFMGTFNLIPAFPADGGRLLRAWLARGGDWLGATETAVRIGRGISVILAIGSFGLLATGTQSLGLSLL